MVLPVSNVDVRLSSSYHTRPLSESTWLQYQRIPPELVKRLQDLSPMHPDRLILPKTSNKKPKARKQMVRDDKPVPESYYKTPGTADGFVVKFLKTKSNIQAFIIEHEDRWVYRKKGKYMNWIPDKFTINSPRGITREEDVLAFKKELERAVNFYKRELLKDTDIEWKAVSRDKIESIHSDARWIAGVVVSRKIPVELRHSLSHHFQTGVSIFSVDEGKIVLRYGVGVLGPKDDPDQEDLTMCFKVDAWRQEMAPDITDTIAGNTPNGVTPLPLVRINWKSLDKKWPDRPLQLKYALSHLEHVHALMAPYVELPKVEFRKLFWDLAIEHQDKSYVGQRGYGVFGIRGPRLMITHHFTCRAAAKVGVPEIALPVILPQMFRDMEIARRKILRVGNLAYHQSRDLLFAVGELCRNVDLLLGFDPESDEWEEGVRCSHVNQDSAHRCQQCMVILVPCADVDLTVGYVRCPTCVADTGRGTTRIEGFPPAIANQLQRLVTRETRLRARLVVKLRPTRWSQQTVQQLVAEFRPKVEAERWKNAITGDLIDSTQAPARFDSPTITSHFRVTAIDGSLFETHASTLGFTQSIFALARNVYSLNIMKAYLLATGIYQSQTKADFDNDVNGCKTFVDSIAALLDGIGAIEEKLPYRRAVLLQRAYAEVAPICREVDKAFDDFMKGMPSEKKSTFHVVDADEDPVYFDDGDDVDEGTKRAIRRVLAQVQSMEVRTGNRMPKSPQGLPYPFTMLGLEYDAWDAKEAKAEFTRKADRMEDYCNKKTRQGKRIDWVTLYITACCQYLLHGGRDHYSGLPLVREARRPHRVSYGKIQHGYPMSSGFTTMPPKDGEMFREEFCNIIPEAWITNLIRLDHRTSDLESITFEQIIPFARSVKPELVGSNKKFKIVGGASGKRASQVAPALRRTIDLPGKAISVHSDSSDSGFYQMSHEAAVSPPPKPAASRSRMSGQGGGVATAGPSGDHLSNEQQGRDTLYEEATKRHAARSNWPESDQHIFENTLFVASGVPMTRPEDLAQLGAVWEKITQLREADQEDLITGLAAVSALR